MNKPEGMAAARQGAILDCVAIVEAWWRHKGRALQNTHAPNLEAARISREEIGELVRRIRSLIIQGRDEVAPSPEITSASPATDPEEK